MCIESPLQGQVLGYEDEYQGMVPASREFYLGEEAYGCADMVISAVLEVCAAGYSGYTEGRVDRRGRSGFQGRRF